MVVLMVILAVVGYERYAVIQCTHSAVQGVKKIGNAEAQDYTRVYDLLFRACMGEKGFMR